MNTDQKCLVCRHEFLYHRTHGVFSPSQGFTGSCEVPCIKSDYSGLYDPCGCTYYIDCLKEEESGALQLFKGDHV